MRGEERRQSLERRVLTYVVDVVEGRAHRLTARAAETIVEHDRIRRALPQRQQRPHDQRVGLALVEPRHAIVGVGRVCAEQAIERVRMIEHTVVVVVFDGIEGAIAVRIFFDSLEQQIRLGAARIVGEVLIGVRDAVRETATVRIEWNG